MRPRPTPVSVIAWFIIVTTCISAVTLLLTINNPLMIAAMSKSPIPMPLQRFMAFSGLLIAVVSGVGMLKGKNWSRHLYVGWSAVSFIINLFTTPFKFMVIPGWIVFAVVVVFLYRPDANAYFTGNGSEAGDAQGG